MPVILVLQERDAGALVSLGENAEGLIIEADAAEHFENFLNIVAVIQRLDAPAERLETLAINADVMAEGGGLALAEAVDVHNGDEILELIDARERCGFPDVPSAISPSPSRT